MLERERVKGKNKASRKEGRKWTIKQLRVKNKREKDRNREVERGKEDREREGERGREVRLPGEAELEERLLGDR